MRILSCIAFLVFCQMGLVAQKVLSPNAQLILWDVAPGQELYSIFGHSALEVRDPELQLRKVYNYGTFDFDSPNFYTKFMQGKLLYYLNIESFRGFEYANMLEQRPMTELVLNLTPEEKQRLFDLLENNSKEANKYYKYEFFYDNCATRIRDIVQEAVFQKITFDSSHVQKGTTMRSLLHDQLKPLPWTEFGIDLVLGTPCDHRPRPEEYMFLPKYLAMVFRNTKYHDGTPLVLSSNTTGTSLPVPDSKTFDPSHPVWVMSLVALIGLLSMFHTKIRRIFDAIFWPVLSLIGILILLLWFATDHTATKMNMNLVWALPTHVLFMGRRGKSEWADNYFLGIGMACLCMLLLWKWLPQQLPVALIPILILIVVKCFYRRFER